MQHIIEHEYRVLSAEEQAVLSAFHAHLGKSMASWASLESILCEWFEHLTGMPEPVARQVFYSTEGGYGKAKMINGVLDVVTPMHKLGEFIKFGTGRFQKYNETRNLLAHGRVIVVNSPPSPHHNKAILVRGRDVPGKPDLSDMDVLTEQQVIWAGDNFGKLAWYLNKGLHWDGKVPEKHPDRFLPQMKKLPNPPHSGPSDQNS